MIAKLAARGASFKGAGNYYLHDKDAQTSERVVWTETVNLWTANPERALKVMAGTAMDRDAIKEAAGIKASGRSSDKAEPFPATWGIPYEWLGWTVGGLFFGGEISIVAGLFVLGDEWWDRFRGLFVWRGVELARPS